MDEDRVLCFEDSCTSSLEDFSLYCSSSEEEIKNKEKEQGHGDSCGVNMRDNRIPTVTELWPHFHYEKPLRFLKLFETQKGPSRWQRVRKSLRKKKKGQHSPQPNLGGPQIVRPPGPEECLTDDETKMMTQVVPQPDSQLADCSQDLHSEEVAPWRYGPAKLWYDMLGVPPHGRGFDYGFKFQEKSPEEETTQTDHPLLKDENFLMLTQKSWEDDIIWDNRDIQKSIPDAQKLSQAGWIPSEKTTLFETGACDPSQPGGSIFLPENEDLIYSQWEDNIIWDAQAMHKPLYPTVLNLDPNDENLLLFDIEEPQEEESPTPSPLAKKQLSEKSQVMRRSDITGVDKAEQAPAPLKTKDPWNLSNDEFYFPQQHGLQVSLTSPIIQHSVPALKLLSSLFPTHMTPEQLCQFHRPPVRWLGKGAHPVHNLTFHIQKKAQEREQELQASGGGHMFFMKTIQDLSGKDGDLILAEWSEENPPLLNQVGMASQIQNYYKRKNGKNTGPPACKYGNPVFCSSSPFLGQFHAGQFLQSLENKLFRAPIYPHQMADTDFLVVVTKEGYFLREVKDIFTVGQQCPLYEVPAPSSKMAKKYIHDFLQVFIYRQFRKSPYRPRRILMEDIRQAFPRLSESSIRRRLTNCSDFHRTGIYLNWWVLKTGFRLPSEEELRDMMTPEKCCALYSMLAAQQRLKNAGYGEILLLNTEETSEEKVCLYDEVQAAPWNTTQAFLAATKGQCLLEVSGAADPTGCGEGISYVKVACKPKQESKAQGNAGKVKGTDADLRRLTLKEAQKLLKTFGMSEEEIRKLSRWEVIAAVRALSTKELHSGTKPRALTRFARVSHSSGTEQQRHYQQEVQRIFDLQNRVLASTEVLSTDTDSSSSDEENDHMMDWMCQGIEDLLEGKTNLQKLQRKKEKQECQELKQLMLRDGGTHLQDKGKKKQQDGGSITSAPVSLVIHRTYIDESGKEYVQKETVRDPEVIKAYSLVRSTKDEDFIRKIFLADEQKQQELRKKKKRLQDRLRRIRIAEERKQQREKRKQVSPEKLPKPEVPKLNLKGSHIKTKICPKYYPPKDLIPRLKGSRKQEEKELAKQLPQNSLIKPQRTKNFTKRKHKFENTNEVQRETVKVRVKKQPLPQKRKSGPPQKRGLVHMDPSEGLSCIRHPCQPTLPCPPSKRRRKSPPPVLSPQVLLERPEKTPGKILAKPPQMTPPSPVHLAQSKSESPSQFMLKDWSLQNWLQQEFRSLTQPCQKAPDFMTQPQKPGIPLAKAEPISPHLLSHSARKSQDPLTCSKPLVHNSSGKQCKRPRNSLCPSSQKLSQEPTIAPKQVSQDVSGRSLWKCPLDKDTQPPSYRNQIPQQYPKTEFQRALPQSIKRSVLYEDLQVSDTDEEEENNKEKEDV